MRKKLIISIISVFLVVVLVLGFNNMNSNRINIRELHNNVATYSNEDAINDYADVILSGTVDTQLSENESVSVGSLKDGNLTDFYTITPFIVEDVYKGEIETDVINIHQPVILTKDEFGEDIKVILENYKEFNIDDTYVVYLRELDNGNYSLVSAYYGQYNLDEKQTRTSNDELSKLRQEVINKFGK